MAMLVVTGTPLADRQADLTPGQLAFLEVAVPRVVARMHGNDVDDEGATASRGSSRGVDPQLRRMAARRRGGG